MKRAIVIIIDGVGVGELPDADQYGDSGSDTLGNMSRIGSGLDLPVLEKLGLGCLHEIKGVSCPPTVLGCYGKMAEMSPGKDSTTGHWELGGIVLNESFPTYPDGFPDEIIDKFIAETGYDILGNFPASGTEIIKDLGEEHLRTGKPIVYTSADSVFQIAAHEDVIPLPRLYEICEISRKILKGTHNIARVIARPFTGMDAASFSRTKYRKDFSVKPVAKTILNILQDRKIPTIAIGKINDLYAYSGIDITIETKQNSEGMKALERAIEDYTSGLIMANLVDFDMLWGHRNDVTGFINGLKKFDLWLSHYLNLLSNNDVLFITSDHGNDPTTKSTDHSREYVPILVYGHQIKSGINLGTRRTFADLHATLATYFDVGQGPDGESFWNLVTG